MSCPCLRSFYDDGNQTVCQRCSSHCSYCLNWQVCTECEGGYLLHEDSLCYNYCPESYFGWAKNIRCEPCHRSCQTCTGPEVHDCLSCKADYIYDNVLKVCSNCYPSLGKITVYRKGIITCDCDETLHRIMNKDDICVCRVGYYESNGKCMKCMDICLGCTNGVSCSTCDPNLHFVMQSNGVCRCEDGYSLQGHICHKIYFDVSVS